MKNSINILSKVISFFGMALLVYVVAFMAWIMLMLGCTQDHSVSECRDNTLTQVVMYPINFIQK